MYRFTSLSFASFVALSSLTTACDDDQSRGPRNGVADGIALSALSDSQAATLCGEFDGYRRQIARATDRIGCTVAALTFGGMGPSCEGYRADCLPPEEPAANCQNPAEQGPLLRCSLSVGEYRACLDAWLMDIEAIDEATTCESNRADVPNYTALRPAPCEIVQANCPELLAD